MSTNPYLRALKDELKGENVEFREGRRVVGVKVPIAFEAQKLAVFVDPCTNGCGCPEHYEGLKPVKDASPDVESPFGPDPTQCQARMERENHRLIDAGWKVLRFWEHDVDRNVDEVAEHVFEALDKVTEKKVSQR